jgi:Cellulase (glycosyl hydrolase family 5)/Cellulose binding domain
MLMAVVSIPSASAASTAPQLHVSGNHLVNASGQTVVLHGVNRSGGEFACVQNTGLWNGPMDQASIDAMKTWGVNIVRVPLNEACWNGESYVAAAFAGTTYQQAVVSYVNLLNSNGIVADLDLHWTDGVYTGNSSACTSAQAICQKPMPDAAQAVPFWSSVATTFKGNNAVVFDLFNEPYPERATGAEASGWQCWLNGGTCAGIPYAVAGMQTLVNTVRATGATNVISLGGLAYSNDLTAWLTSKPTDTSNNLVASWHSYNFNTCSSSSCWTSQISPVAAKVPLIAGEIGENDCSSGYINPLMSFLDSVGSTYLAWTWNNWDCSSGPSLITDYTGTATAYGAGYKAHMLSFGGPTPTPVVTPTITPTPMPTPTATRTAGPSATPVATPTVRPSSTPTLIPTPTPTRTASPTPTVAPTPSGSAGAARCTAAITENAWSNGFTANVTVTNSGTVATRSWKVTWTWNGNQAITNTWNATITQAGAAVTAVNLAYNNVIAAGGNTTFGLQASFSGTNTAPTLTCSAT